ncbi:GNAT family N-acetyltransferase [Marinospirillum alkaliphilum]|uniref:Ribosomal-protein-alanine N-acetyltransferase n=1 Tax=Marinospirillum alkaliphilum DSM 21637 TaxID=1122209 RepID=A0A1K1Z776_9GAMM|nr:GNAT family N-acetyltransferase [Marinospirillum alkaliphilum]SFX69958.1 ribosomal-protein-alanine N-acetyltransferase [Marinospirillum alkaliphilum DSM 21637]
MAAASLYELELLDAAALDEVCHLAARSDPHAWRQESWRSSLMHDWVLGARLDGVLLAVLVLRMGYLETELLYLLVAPEKRRQGLAAMLLDQAVIKSRELHSERMLLEVRASNESAIALYQSRGFVEDGRRRGYYPVLDADDSFEDALLMSLQLDHQQG